MRLILIGLALCLSSCVSAGCPQGQFACTNGECVNLLLRCNHANDCKDGSDELHCDNQCRTPHLQPCKDGHCISMYFFCNGENDCGDWSDELNCTAPVDTYSDPCPRDSFQCGGMMKHKCISLNWVCDGMDDCEDGRDEVNCTMKQECRSGFQCGTKECILNQWVCDGTQDCADGSDEKDCGPDGYLNHACYPEHGWFSCLTKGSKKCMPINRVCDGYDDCDDKSDEGGQCNTSANCSSVTQCEYGCVKTPTGPICTCPQGLRLEGNTCVDIDECAISPPLCSQRCQNLHGSYQCSCATAYTLSKRDNRTCTGNGPELTLFITTDNDIRSIHLPSREYNVVYQRVSQVHSITGYFADGFIYWNEKDRDKAGIFKSHEDGSSHQLVLSAGVETVEDAEIDWVRRLIYFADSGREHIVACDVYGTPCTVVLSDDLDTPRAIALYPEKSLLFWAVRGSRSYIGSAGMDGSARKDIITKDIGQPTGLVVDETIQRIYWSDSQLGRIESANLDGSSRSVLPVTANHPFSIEVFEDSVYWVDRDDHEVLSCNKHSGKNRKVFMKEAKLTPLGIYAHHPSKQRHVEDPCWNVVCSHLCLLSPNSDGFKCACPPGSTLNANNRTCDEISTEKSSLIMATYNELYQLTHHKIGKDSVNRLPTRFLDNIGALAFNPLDHTIIYSDLGKSVIYSMHLNTRREKILFENAEGVEGIAVDPFTNNVYWTEVARGNIVVGHVKVDGSEERIVLARGLESPKGIVLAPEHGLMFVAEGRLDQSIYVRHMDGTSPRELLKAFGSIAAMSFDGDYLYFSDALRGTIEKVSPSGQGRETLRSHLNRLVALDVSGDSIFWLTLSSPRVNWLNQSEPKRTRGFVVDASEDSTQFRILEVIDEFNFTAGHVCTEQSCSDICVPTPTGAKCLCPLGAALSDDQHVCRPINCSDGETFQCRMKCIPIHYRCDGSRDCSSGEDEIGCHDDTTVNTTCAANYFRCNDGQCIPSSFVCDGDYECADHSDEPDTCPPLVCGPDEYSCQNQKRCIPSSAKCDGESDCADGSDETNCPAPNECLHTQFFCNESRLCIPESWLCDQGADCPLGEDENPALCASHAQTETCLSGFIRCPGQLDCIPKSVLCRGGQECASSTDEQLCARMNELDTEVFIAKKPCDDDEFACYMGSNDCIPRSAQCNCKFDCRFGEDEEGCPPCKDGQFRCAKEKKYIDPTWVCDGFNDCEDGSDESPDVCRKTTIAPAASGIFHGCKPDEFECLNGQCIPFSSTCDGNRDCADGTDEGTNCFTSCTVNNGNCSQLCKPSPGGPICECGPGYISEWDGRVCHDIDECETEQHLCSQFCSNTKGRYLCSCAPGYKLEHDHHTCKLIDGRPMIVVAGPSQVELLLPMHASFSPQLVTSDVPIKDVVYNDQLSTLYFVTSAGVSRTNSRGTKLIFPMSGLLPSAIALDRATGNIYLSALVNSTGEQDRSTIKVISRPSNADVNIVTTPTIITDLAIDNVDGVLFWSDHSKHANVGRIIRSAMDGSSTRWFDSLSKVQYPVALTLDTVTRRVYWADLMQHTISSCGYSGANQRMIVTNTQAAPLSLAFFEGRISWTALGHSAIYSQAVRNGTLLIQPLNGVVTQIGAVHSVLQPAVPNPCASSPCNNGICVLKNNASFSCYCPQEVALLSTNPFRCGESSDVLGEDPFDAEEITSSSGVTVASTLVCLVFLAMLGVLCCVYYRRWRRSVGSPLKFRFRSALGLSGESAAWEESIDHSDRKRLFKSSQLEDPEDHIDHNENRRPSISIRIQSDSAYASQQSLAKPRPPSNGAEHEPQQLLPASYSMKDHLLASEL